MRIVFMGTPEFAVEPLTRLYTEGYDIAGVFTQPDRAKNRGMKLSFSPVKMFAMEHEIPVYQPETLRGSEVLDILRGLRCDIIVVVAYGKLLPVEMLQLPPLGCVNVHASLLPKYRGAAPIQWAVLNGERETGVTVMYMADELDAGDVLYSRKTTIGDNETAGQLYEKLSILGAELLCESLDAISGGFAPREPQKHDEATFAPPLRKDMSPISWSDSAFNIKCKVRGLNPWPVASAALNGSVFKIFSVDFCCNETAGEPGTIISAGKHGVEVACGDGSVVIKELQAQGGKRMEAAAYLRGNPL